MPKADDWHELQRRREREYWAKQRGKSIAEIAREEGVSRQVVMRDLKIHHNAQLKAIGATLVLTDATTESIVTLVGFGVAPELAAQRAGVLPETFGPWLEAGKQAAERLALGSLQQDQVPYLRLYVAVLQAEGQDAVNRIMQLNKHSETQWQPGWKLLQARHPEHYGDKSQVDVNTNVTFGAPDAALLGEAAMQLREAQREGLIGALPQRVESRVALHEARMAGRTPDSGIVDSSAVQIFDTEPATQVTKADRAPPKPDPYTEQPLRGDAEQ